MIDIRELKIRNWVNHKDCPLKICSIIGTQSGDTTFSSVTFVGHPIDEPKWSTEIEPIPFTTEWAQRFGLIGRIINGLCISESEYQGHEYDLCLYDEHTWDSERRVICPIYYVHQCQNIFLDLAGHIIE